MQQIGSLQVMTQSFRIKEKAAEVFPYSFQTVHFKGTL